MNLLRFGLGCLLIVAMSACDDDSVRVYPAPRDQPFVPASVNASPPTHNHAAPVVDETIRWTLPASWEERAGTGMRRATILIGPADQRMELTVVPLPAIPGTMSVLDNVNRWRGELKLEPIKETELEKCVTRVEGPNIRALLVDLRTEPMAERMLAGIIPRGDKVWFLKVRGPEELIAAEHPAFEEFLRSVRFESAQPASATPSAPPASTAPFTFDTPAGWEAQTELGPMRIAAFWATHDGDRAEVTVTAFPGSAGTALDNINRWRGQIKLPPVSDISQQPVESVSTPTGEMSLLDLVGEPDDAGQRQRMLTAIIAHDGRTWFFKMLGPESAVAAHRDKFLAFLQSIRFTPSPLGRGQG